MTLVIKHKKQLKLSLGKDNSDINVNSVYKCVVNVRNVSLKLIT